MRKFAAKGTERLNFFISSRLIKSHLDENWSGSAFHASSGGFGDRSSSEMSQMAKKYYEGEFKCSKCHFFSNQ